MKIAIVDDMKQDSEKLKKSIFHYFSDKEMPFEYEIFENGEDFLSFSQNKHFDLVFLDIFMEGADGISTAQILRKADLNCLLVFLTSSTEHMADAFSVHAFGYLGKPLDDRALYRILDDACKLYAKKQPFLEIPLGKQTAAILYSDILYVTADSNYIEIHADKHYRCRMSFSRLTDDLNHDGRFLIINRGVLVNLDHVISMENFICCLKDGSSFPVNRKKEASLQQAYITRQFALRTGKVSKGGTV